MARVLIVYHRAPKMMWRSTYASHLSSFERFSNHEVYYLNTAWPRVPGYLRNLKPDLVIFHYTFLAVRWVRPEFEVHLKRIAFLENVDCPKAIVPHDEHIYTDRLVHVVNTFGVTNIFTPASEPQWRQIYEGADFTKIQFTQVLTGYLDEESVQKFAERSKRLDGRPIDVGYRSWAVYPNFGRHSRLKSEIGRRFQERAPEFGLKPDISSSIGDALLGDKWFDFLLDCKYTIGVEGGASILDRDGGARERTLAYQAEHPGATFEEVEAACFPGRGGELDYRLLGPRHFEAVMTRTCQVLIEGTYGGALEAGMHYIPLQEDFGNLDDVLETMKRDDLRAGMVERAYQDVVESGRWTYQTLADTVFENCLPATGSAPDGPASGALIRHARWGITATVQNAFAWAIRTWRLVVIGWHRLYWIVRIALGRVFKPVRVALSRLKNAGVKGLVGDVATRIFGEERLWKMTAAAKNRIRKLRGAPPLDYGEYTPTEAELARRERTRGGSE